MHSKKVIVQLFVRKHFSFAVFFFPVIPECFILLFFMIIIFFDMCSRNTELLYLLQPLLRVTLFNKAVIRVNACTHIQRLSHLGFRSLHVISSVPQIPSEYFSCLFVVVFMRNAYSIRSALEMRERQREKSRFWQTHGDRKCKACSVTASSRTTYQHLAQLGRVRPNPLREACFSTRPNPMVSIVHLGEQPGRRKSPALI